VISFVLGFALASLIAWLGSIRSDEVAVPTPPETVASLVIPVVTAATGEKTPTITQHADVSPDVPLPLLANPGAAPALSTQSSTQPHVEVLPASANASPSPPVTATPVKAPTAAPVKAPAAPVQTQPQPRPAVTGYRGVLALSSTPDGAEVVVNGQVVGRTPVVLSDLPVGSRALVVRRDGYSPWSTSVRIVANQRTIVRATLVPVHHTGG
jgi:hypothetical protein